MPARTSNYPAPLPNWERERSYYFTSAKRKRNLHRVKNKGNNSIIYAETQLRIPQLKVICACKKIQTSLPCIKGIMQNTVNGSVETSINVNIKFPNNLIELWVLMLGKLKWIRFWTRTLVGRKTWLVHSRRKKGMQGDAH